jgi:hypothetical protein
MWAVPSFSWIFCDGDDDMVAVVGAASGESREIVGGFGLILGKVGKNSEALPQDLLLRGWDDKV